MAKNFSFFIGDESLKLIERYENYLSGNGMGYFDVYEMEQIIEFYLYMGKTTDSVQALELAKRLHPQSTLLDLKRAKVNIAIGEYRKAYQILSRSFEAGDAEVIFLKIEVLIKLNRIDEAFELALFLLGEENDELDAIAIEIALLFTVEYSHESALKILQIGYKLNPNNLELLSDLAQSYEQNFLYSEAIATYQRIVDLSPYSQEDWFNLGQLHFLVGDYEAAIEAYDFALAIDEQDFISLLQKAHAFFHLGQFDRSIEFYKECNTSTEESWHINLFIAECYENLERFTEALFYYKQSFQVKPENYDALIGIAVSYLELEEYEESILYINLAINHHKESSEPWVYLGDAYFGLNNLEKAIFAYKEAIKIDPNQPDIYISLGNIYMEKENPHKALTYYENAYNSDATIELIELYIAVASYYIGNYEKAVAFLKMAINRNLGAAQLFTELCPLPSEEFIQQLDAGLI